MLPASDRYLNPNNPNMFQCYGPSLYVPSLLCAEFAMCRVCYGPSLSCAEFAMCRVVQYRQLHHNHTNRSYRRKNRTVTCLKINFKQRKCQPQTKIVICLNIFLMAHFHIFYCLPNIAFIYCFSLPHRKVGGVWFRIIVYSGVDTNFCGLGAQTAIRVIFSQKGALPEI